MGEGEWEGGGDKRKGVEYVRKVAMAGKEGRWVGYLRDGKGHQPDTKVRTETITNTL